MSDILRISVPLTIWLAAFSTVYGIEGLTCSERWAQAGLSQGIGRAILIAAWLGSIGIQVGFLLALRSPRFASTSSFVREVSSMLAATALVATIWTLMPVATVSICL